MTDPHSPADETPTGPVPPPGPQQDPGSQTGTQAPPPITAFAWRHRLVRPVQGRYIAGVSGALARATNTDPILWRVLLVVFTIAGGVGVGLYLVAWLLTPADGDTATPLEALGHRGSSRTSPGWTILLLIIMAASLAGSVSEPYHAAPLIALAVLAGVVLLLVRERGRGDRPGQDPWAGTGAGPVPNPSQGPPQPFAPQPFAPQPFAPEPFAPHGPFAGPQPTYYDDPALRRRRRRPRSRLGLLTLSVILVVLGGLTLANLSGFDIPPAVFVATPLAIIGLGLVIGAWVGRAYGLIPFGLALCLALSATHGIHGGQWRDVQVGTVVWQPTSVADISSSYQRGAGDATLDLSNVDFTGQNVSITVDMNLGSLRVRLPDRVTAIVTATVDTGNANVFNQNWNGINNETHTITDNGVGNAGTVHITATVHVGNLEVSR